MTYNLLDELTDREREIIPLLSEGLSNKEIANRLFLAPSTVKWYVRQLNSKLHTGTRDEIVETAEQLGLLDAPSQQSTYWNRRENLPRQTTPFIGRDEEIAEIHGILEKDNVQLLTILAQGGMGKTRIALEVAEQQMHNFPDGVYFVGLQPISDVEQIVPEIASSVGLEFSSNAGDPAQQVLGFLSDKQLLLVMDNWEHLVDGVSIVNEILRYAPDVKMIATSREKLNLSVETVYMLQGMHFPEWETPEDALEYDAVQLLLEATQRTKPGWEITPDNLNHVARVCRITQGMPLGILLAMSWLDMLPIEDIAAEIQQSADFLETTMRDIPERQQSIRMLFEYSWNKLNDQERAAFMKMSVFRGGFSRQAGQAIAGANLRLYQALVNKSLLQIRKDGHYDLHALLRQYAEGKLTNSGMEADTRKAHAEYYASALRDQIPNLKGHGQLEAINDIVDDLENVRIAWQWAVKHQHFALIGHMHFALAYVTRTRNVFRERGIANLFEAALHALEDESDPQLSVIRALCQATYAEYVRAIGDSQRAMDLCRNSVATCRAAQDDEGLAHALYVLGFMFGSSGNMEEALAACIESFDVYTRLGDKWGIARTHFILGFSYFALGHYEQGYEHTHQSYLIRKDIGDKNGTADSINNLGAHALSAGDYVLAEDYGRQSLDLRREMQTPSGIVWSAAGLVRYALSRGDLDEAQRLTDEAFALSSKIPDATTRSFPYSALSAVASSSGDYETALKHAQTAYDLAQQGSNRDAFRNTRLMLGLAYSAVGQFDTALPYLRPAIGQEKGLLPTELVIMPFVMILADRQHHEWAVELLGFMFNLPIQEDYHWFDRHPRVTELRAQLRAELGENAYQTAWDRGASSDFDTVIQKLNDEFGTEDD